ncbi:MMPL/RND family transporter [Candidatus Mycobacterium methanotrophicum]|uniref:RND family transporter n=1 Tax=Candidatus Mycobacterium methanotrophicum TaxID=2943498 RepID=A0ABY4QIN2_9MYCO|nr:RND family transporter [Candidatus Mycobacterium methanotrophicum]UQX09669.1 RND family transporter [Candidatus Mycobacterium methanotrophicum]
MNNHRASNERAARVAVAGAVRKFAVPIILSWVAVTLMVSFGVPSLEQVAANHAVSLSTKDASSVKAMARMGELFKESNSDSVAVIVLEGEQPLGEAAHKYYDSLIRQLKADTKHVQYLQDFWGDPLTAAAAQSADGKAAYVQVYLAGNQGEAKANQSVDAVRNIIQHTPSPKAIKAYVTGPAALVTDMYHSGDRTVIKVMVATVAVIFIMLLLVYRSFLTVILLLVMVGIELAVARGIIALLAEHDIIRVSIFAINLLVSLTVAAGTDYGIFFIGRYHEARQAGEDRETAYYTAYHGVAHVVLASGLTIAGATYCLSFTRLPIFQTLGAPCAIAMLITVAVALTLVPAVLAVCGRFSLLDPKRKIKVRGWRRVGTAVVRWPGPIFAATCAVTLVGLVALPGYKVSYKDRLYLPRDIPGNIGIAAAERHFSQARLMPEILLIESDHDMRNSADFLVLDKLAKGIFRVEGISRVESITRPEGTPLAHTSIPFLLSMQTAGQLENIKFAKSRLDDMMKLADELGGTITAAEHMNTLMQQLAGTSHHMVGVTKETEAIAAEVRQNIDNVNTTLRPLRGYFDADPNCDNVQICSAIKSVYQSMGGVDKLSDKLSDLVKDLDSTDAALPQLLALLPPQIATMKSVRTMVLSMHSTVSGMFDQADQLSGDATAMGQDFDAAKSDDSFYLPREVFANPDFQRVMKLFVSPDGKAARFIISHRGDPATDEGIARIGALRTAAYEALKGTPLEDSKVYIAGTASIFKDLQTAANYDFLIAGIASLCMIFIIMLMITRSIVAALVIVGTVALSLGSSFGLSVLLWQYILGFNLHWLVMVMSVIVLLAVGSDYNLLLVARFKQEIGAGLKTGIIRSMGGTGKVVTAAGLVFAFTMASLVVSDLRMVGQVGTTVALGLVFDTLIVRAFLTPSIAALLGRWFWWPLTVRSRPARVRYGPVSADLELAITAINGSSAPVTNGSAKQTRTTNESHPLVTNGAGHRWLLHR